MNITIIGSGLIGGSLALALKRHRPEHYVVCLDLPERVPAIQVAGVADAVGSVNEFAAYIPQSDLVVAATPVQFVPETLSALRPFLKADTIVTDVGSTKSNIMASASSLMPPGVHFIGGHPMSGSERSGVEAADPLLFRGKVYMLCPYQHTPPDALLTLIEWVESLGALPLTIDPAEHDRILAMISHLPHFISVALMHTARMNDAEHGMLAKLAGRGFLDMTRLAAADYTMWKGIMATNADAIADAMEKFNRHLQLFVKDMTAPGTETIWEEAARLRRTMTPETRLRPRKQDWRSVIDRLDKQFISILAQRFNAVRKIGTLKAHQSAPVTDPDREKRMMKERSDWGQALGLPEEMIEELFAVILKHSTQIQELGVRR